MILRTDDEVREYARRYAVTNAVRSAITQGRVSAIRRLTAPSGFEFEVTTEAGITWQIKLVPNQLLQRWTVKCQLLPAPTNP